jgi:serine/threonine protein kinase
MAPEVMVKRSHSYTADYYALGVIAFELMLGRRPYIGSNRKEIKDQILARQVAVKVDQLPFKWSPYSLDFINRVLFE